MKFFFLEQTNIYVALVTLTFACTCKYNVALLTRVEPTALCTSSYCTLHIIVKNVKIGLDHVYSTLNIVQLIIIIIIIVVINVNNPAKLKVLKELTF